MLKVTGNSVKVEVRLNGQYVRRTIDKKTFCERVLNAESSPDSNLVAGAKEISFKDFCQDVYLHEVKRRLKNPGSLATSIDHVNILSKHLGNIFVHRFQNANWEEYKGKRVSLRTGGPVANNTLLGERTELYLILESAMLKGLIRLHPFAGLREKTIKQELRTKMWLRKPQVVRLLEALVAGHQQFRNFCELILLTGARPGEALLMKEEYLHLKPGFIAVPTEKRDGDPADHLRFIEVSELGPRFPGLIERIQPHPVTGFFFAANEATPLGRGKIGAGRPLTKQWYAYHWRRLRERVPEFKPYTPHDLRRTRAMHRAMVIKDFMQLMTEQGWTYAGSTEAYISRTEQHRREDSYFFVADSTQECSKNRTVNPGKTELPEVPVVLNIVEIQGNNGEAVSFI